MAASITLVVVLRFLCIVALCKGTYSITCFSCLSITHPRFCSHVQDCAMNHVCGLEKIVHPSGETTFNVGCFEQWTCHDNNTDLIPHETCRHCCQSNLCNVDGCGEKGITHERGPICYHCDGVLTMNECNTISVCENGEACFIEEQFSLGERFYTTSCQYKNICNVITSGRPVIGKRQDHILKRSQTACTRCCYDDMCNRECLPHTETTTTQILTTTKLPSTTANYNIRDCTDLKGRYSSNGVYQIYPKGPPGYKVYCDMTTDGGGWTVFQHRFNGAQLFHNKLWNDYRNGFGNVSDEYWLGNDHLHELLSLGHYVLRIDLGDWENNSRYAVYNTFYVGSALDNYRLTVDNYSGDAGDGLSLDNNAEFSTVDAQHDSNTAMASCAGIQDVGAWWYERGCGYANLNGQYLQGGKHTSYHQYVMWYPWKGNAYSLKSTKMMVRRN